MVTAETLSAGIPDIPTTDIPAAVRDERDTGRRRDRLTDWLEREYAEGRMVSPTSLLAEPESTRIEVNEIVTALQRSEGRVIPAERPLSFEPRARLATISGRPLASPRKADNAHLKGVKVGQRAFNGRECRDFERRGGDPNIYRSYPAVFECGLVEAANLLARYGFRQATSPESWLLFEVGGPLEEDLCRWLADQAAEKGEDALAARARAIRPDLFDQAQNVGSEHEPQGRRRTR
jgi:hypothetical protein